MGQPEGVEIRENIINILRGRYATSILSTLGYLGVAEMLIKGQCRIQDFSNIANKRTLQAILDYLVSINLLISNNGVYETSTLGRHVLARSGSASIIESYNDYLTNLPIILAQKTSNDEYKVDRPLNIYGSGDIHKRKFFPKAISMSQEIAVESLIDLGCGDGTYLEIVGASAPSIKYLTGVDLSSQSTKASGERLSTNVPHAKNICITCDAFNVAQWSKDLPDVSGPEVISAWFVLHEFSEGKVERIVEFFNKIHQNRPGAHVLIGELVRSAPHELAQNSSRTIMPEFLFFHALSGQAPLSWQEWNEIKQNIPYTLIGECIFDAIEINNEPTPSNFIWLFSPKA